MDDQITLADWLKANKCTQEELGSRVRCSGEHVGRIAKNDPRVSQQLALRIFDETGVKVGPLRGMANTDIAVVRRLNPPSEAGAAA